MNQEVDCFILECVDLGSKDKWSGVTKTLEAAVKKQREETFKDIDGQLTQLHKFVKDRDIQLKHAMINSVKSVWEKKFNEMIKSIENE